MVLAVLAGKEWAGWAESADLLSSAKFKMGDVLKNMWRKAKQQKVKLKNNHASLWKRMFLS